MKTIIFDMDGTLVDSSLTISKTVNFMRNKLGLGPETKENIMKIINDPTKNLSKDIYFQEELQEDFLKESEKVFKNFYFEYSKLFEGIMNLLNECKNSGFLLAVASNAPENTLKSILELHKIEKFFFDIKGVSEEIPQKPNPKMLNLIKNAQKHDVLWLIGDSQKDFEAATNANINYLHVLWGFGEVNDAKYYAQKPENVLDILFNN